MKFRWYHWLPPAYVAGLAVFAFATGDVQAGVVDAAIVAAMLLVNATFIRHYRRANFDQRDAMEASAVSSLVESGYTRASAVEAIQKNDWNYLRRVGSEPMPPTGDD